MRTNFTLWIGKEFDSSRILVIGESLWSTDSKISNDVIVKQYEFLTSPHYDYEFEN